MSRKDYVLIAKTISNIKKFISAETQEIITSAFCKSLKEENSSFNEQKFKEAVGGIEL